MPNSNQLVSVRITDSRLSVSLFTDIITIVIIYFYTMRLHTALVLLCCTKFVESQDFIVLKDSKSAAVEPSGRLAVSSPLNFIVIQTPSVQLQSAQSATGAAVSSQPTSTVSSTVTVVTTSTSTSTLTTALSSSGSGGGSGNADSATSTTSTTSAQMTQLADQAVTSARGISIITTTISVTATNSPSPIALPMPTILTISVSQTAPPQTITIQQQQAAVPQAPPFQTPFPAYLPGGGGGGGGVAMHPAPVVQPLQAPAYPQPMAPPMAPLAGAAAAAPVYGQQLPPPVIIPTITVQQQMPPPMAPMAPMAPQPAASAPLAPQPAAAAPFAAPQPPVAQPLIAPLQATATGTTTSPAVPPLPSDVLQFPFPAGKYRGGDDYGGYGGYGNRHNRYNDEYMLMKPNAAAVNALLADPAPFTTRNPLPVLRATQTEVVTVGGQMAMRGSTVVLDPPRPGIVEVFEDFFLGTPAKSYLVPGGSGGSGGGGMHTVRAAALKSGGNVAMALEQQKEQAEQEPHVFTMEINNHYSDNNGNGNGNGSNEVNINRQVNNDGAGDGGITGGILTNDNMLVHSDFGRQHSGSHQHHRMSMASTNERELVNTSKLLHHQKQQQQQQQQQSSIQPKRPLQSSRLPFLAASTSPSHYTPKTPSAVRRVPSVRQQPSSKLRAKTAPRSNHGHTRALKALERTGVSQNESIVNAMGRYHRLKATS